MVMSAAQTGKQDAAMAAFSDSTKKEANGGRGLQSLRSVSALEDEEKRAFDHLPRDRSDGHRLAVGLSLAGANGA